MALPSLKHVRLTQETYRIGSLQKGRIVDRKGMHVQHIQKMSH